VNSLASDRLCMTKFDAAHSGGCPATPPVVEILLPQVPNAKG